MANITLPSNPVNGQTVVIGTRLFQYDSTAGRWKSRVFQVLGDTSITVPNESPTITASLSEIALDTSGANVSFTYTVSDVDSSILKVSHSVSGIANSDLATVTHHRANNTVTITAGTEAFEGGQITLTVTDGRNNATDTVDVSAAYESTGWEFVRFSQSIDENNNPIDQVGTYTFTAVGNATTSDAQTKFASRSLYFPDNSSYYQMPGGLLTSEPMIAEAWIYPTGNSEWNIIGNRNTGSSGDSGFEMRLYRTSGGIMRMEHGGYSSENNNGAAPLNQWTHVAFGFIGSGGSSNPNVLGLFVNGARVAAASGQTLYYTPPQDPVHIGGGNTGYIENVQVVRTAKYGTSYVIPTAEQTQSYQNPYDT